MKIHQLTAENVKRLKAVEITPDGNMVVVGGRNGQGKTSLLDSIFMALGGKSAQGKKPVRRGEEKAKITLDLGDMLVTRTITKEGGGTIKVTNKDGAVYPSPQAMLDALVSKISFDPVSFAMEKPGKQLEILKGLVGLDFTAQDAERKRLYDERTNVNREGTEKKARLDGIVHHKDAPEQEVSVSALMDELSKAEAKNRSNRESRELAEYMRDGVTEAVQQIESLHEQVAELERQSKEWGQKLKKREIDLLHHEKMVDILKDEDEQTIREKIGQADAVNQKVRGNISRATLEKEVNALREKSQGLTDKIHAIEAGKAKQMSAASFPVAGLGFDENGITYDGLPFEENCSSAEQLRISVGMGIAMNPKLRVLLIRDGSLLDEDNLKMIAEMAAQSDAQVWIERVGKGQECSLIIEDGMVEMAEVVAA